MCLRFAFLLISQLAARLRLSRREETWKAAETLLLRHQLTVLQRHQPCRLKLTWADRANLVAVPALPGRRDPGLRFLHGRPARRHPGLRPGRDRARQQAHPHPWRHPAPDRGMDRPAGRNLIMDLDEQAHRVRFMIRDRGSNFTTAFDVVLADAGIRTVLCNVRTPRMNAIAERWIGGCRRELLDRALVWNQAHLRQILRQYEAHHNRHRPHRSLKGAAPLKPLPEPVNLEQYRVRRQARVGGLINEYRLVA